MPETKEELHARIEALEALIEKGHAENAAIAAKIEAMEHTLSCISDSLGVNGDADADLAGIMQDIDEAVPHYAIDDEGNEASTLSERIDYLVRERDALGARRDSLARSRRDWIDAATSVLDPEWNGTPDALKAALTKMRDEHAEWSHRPDADLYGRTLDTIENLTTQRDAALRAHDEHTKSLCVAHEAAYTKLRAECERLRKALKDISTWREDCHAYDDDQGHERRDFDDEESVELIEKFAAEVLAKHEGG